LLVFNWAKQILKIARDFEPALGEPRRARRASVSVLCRASRAKLNARAGPIANPSDCYGASKKQEFLFTP